MDSEAPQTTSLIRKRTDNELMPPPPAAKRIKRPKTVLDEDSYTQALSHILARDFFPGLLESQTQNEYLDALESRDVEWISSASRRLQSVMTPGRSRTRLNTPSHAGGRTPVGYNGDTPKSTAASSIASAADGLKGAAIDTNMSLGSFQAKYTSEDNESFYKLLDKQNQKKMDKYAWVWTGNKLPSKMQLKQREVEMKLAKTRASLVDDGFAKDRLAIKDKDDRPAQPDHWQSKPNNELMFPPEGVDGVVESVAERAQTESRAAPKMIVYENTRVPQPHVPRQQRASSPTLSEIRGAISGKRRGCDQESSTGGGEETPRVNGYTFVDEEEPVSKHQDSAPIIDLGAGDATPNPFQLQEQGKREALHHRMVERIAQSQRTSARLGVTGKVERTPVPKFPSSPRVSGGLTPAAQRLWGKIDSAGRKASSSPFNGAKRSLHLTTTPMRFADLLVDLAAVAIASRSVAAKHIALRARQLDRYQKTSSIVSSLAQQRQQKHPKDAQYQSQKQSQTSSQGWDESVASAQPLPDSEPPIVRSEQFVQPAVRSQDNPAKPRPGFTPAPWASRAAVAAAAGTRALMPTHRPVPVSPTGNPPDQSDALPSEGVDFNIFRTSKGSRILESLKEKPRSEPSVPRPPIQVSSGDEIAAPRPEMEISPAGFDALTDLIAGARPRSVETSASDTTHTRAAVVEEVAPTAEPLAEQDAILVAELAARTPSTAAYELRESTVPSSRIGRLWNYGGLAAGMFAGAIGEGLSRAVGGGSSQGSVMLSAANMERLVTKLSRMRGAALKLGQMMSFQDAKMLPAPMQEVLQRVQDRADYMPAWQRDRVLTTDLGAEWRDLFDEFEDKPIAAASIGQVHRATLKSNSARVAVKIQFPGVADSINSDLDNISILLVATQMLPKGLYLNKTIDNARTELAWECDYEREAECAGRYRELLAGNDDDVFSVPKMYPEACGKHVLTMEFMDGVGVTRVKSFTQEQRDWIGTQILRLCLREITEFKFMQTDPNWTNFLYNAEKKKLELLDFGASREYPDEFISRYVQLLDAASRSDRDQVKILSEELGYLTGHESKAMLDAHIISVTTLAEPFLQSAPEIYDFRDQTITERVKAQIPVMIHERLAPPPEETYSLHRKLSGAFLLCARLGSRVRCRELFENALAKMVN
ncbi:nuclear protein Es2-domain-containing protein [Podospora didyma]|uniref:Nuclear protein Es2-domain-containing protein n=1 Tax=Podospora didyma TaxID=330526 RepID=A0AAE0K594_9PEZI|nr:nuclear protein Es2-domain-containing protein [Podospora didyma]